ncbi:hypothetical protein [Ensifer sp. ENS08]|uniref:hypothetical protein n=1 Tax=Ensifer sp. ENS08 TaxID=2769273 RepID=UPI000AF65546|nr:hypothetical protein [Ensifer sp. ENS08]MBD9573437.1 hypothetical protein [Ensifer sp. ENS08]
MLAIARPGVGNQVFERANAGAVDMAATERGVDTKCEVLRVGSFQVVQPLDADLREIADHARPIDFACIIRCRSLSSIGMVAPIPSTALHPLLTLFWQY